MNTNKHKVTKIKDNASSLGDVKQHQHFNTSSKQCPKPSATRLISPRSAPGNGRPSLERRRLTDRPDSATRQVLTDLNRTEPIWSELTQRGDSPWFQLDGSSQITSLRVLPRTCRSRKRPRSRTRKSGALLKLCVGAAQDVQPGSKAPPAGAA